MARLAEPDELDLSHLPNNIRRLRLERRLSQEQLAELIPGRIPPQTLARLETGETRLTDNNMVRVAAGLSKAGAPVHPMQLMKDAPGAPRLEDMQMLEPEESALVSALRRMPSRERERLLAIVKAAAPDYFAPAL